MKQEHHPKDRKAYHKGAKPDLDPRILGDAENTDGSYYDAVNMRQSSGDDGSYTSLVPIDGWESVEDGRSLPTDREYRCIGAFSVNGHLVEFWVHVTDVSINTKTNSAQKPPVIIIDGTLVAESYELGFKADKPLQGDVNESCVGGEVYVTDDYTEPRIFNVQDLLDSVGTDKYFSSYDSGLNSINLTTPIDIPVFIGINNVGGGGGLPVGKYRYSMRYVSSNGDRTNWTPATPMIDVPAVRNTDSRVYPYVMTKSGPPDPSVQTPYAIKLRFRVTNLLGYDSIELKREDWNAGAGINYTPDSKIVYREDVDDGEISTRTFIDPNDSNKSETVPEEEEVQEQTFIKSAKAIRYFDRRLNLANIETQSKTVDGVNFDTFSVGGEVIPKIGDIGKNGFNDSWQAAYRRSYMRGEKHSFGVEFYDSIAGKSFARELVNNFEMPNRRDPMTAESEKYSYGFPTKALSTNRGIARTFEAYDLDPDIAERKQDHCSFYSIANPDNISTLTGGKKYISKVDDVPYGNCSGIPSHADQNSVYVGVDYRPLTPTPLNSSAEGHDYVINPEVDTGSGRTKYNPKGFAPQYKSLGIAVKGIKNIPSWVKGFSVVRSEPAGRVVAQGIGMYHLKPGDFNSLIGNEKLMTKDQQRMIFHSTDIQDGFVDSDVVEDIKNNPQNYKVQLVSPVGFFSEVYNFQPNSFNGRSRIIDMISYANIIKDRKGSLALINPDPSGGETIGKQDADRMYVDWGKWRNRDYYGKFGSPGSPDGNYLFDVSTFSETTEGRNTYFEIGFDENVYGIENVGGTSSRDFEDDGNKDFHEPLYIVNIVRTGAQVSDDNIDKFKPTGHFQKVESIIGVSNGQGSQEFDLIDERWEDCIPDLYSNGPLANENRYVYVSEPNEPRQAWVNVTYKSSSEISSIKNDISSNGFWTAPDGTSVYGVFEHYVDSIGRTAKVRFNHKGYEPAEGKRIWVLYDDRTPISVYGGNVVTAPSIFAPIDRQVSGENQQDNLDKQFVMNSGFPYLHWRLNPRYYQLNKGANGNLNFLVSEDITRLAYIRQLCMMYISESYSSGQFRYQGSFYSQQFFPQVHYVMRPHKDFDTSQSLAANGVYSQYGVDYPGEKSYWNWGGFRFDGIVNSDHSAKPSFSAFTKPESGFEEENDFCTLYIWSMKRAINTQDSPGLRTFPSTNKFFISDDQGEVKFLYDNMSEKGRNIFAITERGVCLLMTKKSVLSDTNADELAYISNENYVSDEYWLTKNIGCRGHFWQGKAEGRLRVSQEGSNKHTEVLMWPDVNGVYQMIGTNIQEVTRGKYSSRMLPELEDAFYGERLLNTPMEAVIDEDNNEYWLHIIKEAAFIPFVDDDITSGPILNGVVQNYEDTEGLHVFNMDTNEWSGRFMYSFDEYVFHNNSVVGLRKTTAYWLDQGSVLPCHVEQISSGKADAEHEFVRIQVNTDHMHGSDEGKPDRILFIDEDGNVMCEVSQVEQGQYYVKRYDGWEAFIPRVSRAYSTRRERIQGDYVRYRIEWDDPAELVLRSTNVQFKDLK